MTNGMETAESSTVFRIMIVAASKGKERKTDCLRLLQVSLSSLPDPTVLKQLAQFVTFSSSLEVLTDGLTQESGRIQGVSFLAWKD